MAVATKQPRGTNASVGTAASVMSHNISRAIIYRNGPIKCFMAIINNNIMAESVHISLTRPKTRQFLIGRRVWCSNEHLGALT